MIGCGSSEIKLPSFPQNIITTFSIFDFQKVKMTTFKDILQNQTAVKVIDASIDYRDYVAFDLSVQHTDELNLDLIDAEKFEEFVENHLSVNHAKVAFGGY